MTNRNRWAASFAAAVFAGALAMTSPADALCTHADLEADRMLGPMVGFLPATPPTAADRAVAASRLREIRAMVAPYRRSVEPPPEIDRYAAAGMLAPVASPAALAEHGPRYLLYRKTGRDIRLEAVEFTFANETPVRELDAILPRSIARWHQTTRHCTKPPPFMWTATVFPYAHGDAAIWHTLEVPKYVEIAPKFLRRGVRWATGRPRERVK